MLRLLTVLFLLLSSVSVVFALDDDTKSLAGIQNVRLALDGDVSSDWGISNSILRQELKSALSQAHVNITQQDESAPIIFMQVYVVQSTEGPGNEKTTYGYVVRINVKQEAVLTRQKIKVSVVSWQRIDGGGADAQHIRSSLQTVTAKEINDLKAELIAANKNR